MSNLVHFPLGGNFLKNCLITFSLFCHEASQGGCWWTAKRSIWLNHSKGQFSRSKKGKSLLLFANFLKIGLITFLYVLYTASWGWYWSTVKRWISLNYSKGHFQVGKVRFSPFSHNYWYYSVVLKCCPNLLHHIASLLWNQYCLKIWTVWNQYKGHKGPIWTFVIYFS